MKAITSQVSELFNSAVAELDEAKLKEAVSSIKNIMDVSDRDVERKSIEKEIVGLIADKHVSLESILLKMESDSNPFGNSENDTANDVRRDFIVSYLNATSSILRELKFPDGRILENLSTKKNSDNSILSQLFSWPGKEGIDAYLDLIFGLAKKKLLTSADVIKLIARIKPGRGTALYEAVQAGHEATVSAFLEKIVTYQREEQTLSEADMLAVLGADKSSSLRVYDSSVIGSNVPIFYHLNDFLQDLTFAGNKPSADFIKKILLDKDAPFLFHAVEKGEQHYVDGYYSLIGSFRSILPGDDVKQLLLSSRNGVTALSKAMELEYSELIEELLQGLVRFLAQAPGLVVDVLMSYDKNNESALYSAIANNKVDSVQSFLQVLFSGRFTPEIVNKILSSDNKTLIGRAMIAGNEKMLNAIFDTLLKFNGPYKKSDVMTFMGFSSEGFREDWKEVIRSKNFDVVDSFIKGLKNVKKRFSLDTKEIEKVIGLNDGGVLFDKISSIVSGVGGEDSEWIKSIVDVAISADLINVKNSKLIKNFEQKYIQQNAGRLSIFDLKMGFSVSKPDFKNSLIVYQPGQGDTLKKQAIAAATTNPGYIVEVNESGDGFAWFKYAQEEKKYKLISEKEFLSGGSEKAGSIEFYTIAKLVDAKFLETMMRSDKSSSMDERLFRLICDKKIDVSRISRDALNTYKLRALQGRNVYEKLEFFYSLSDVVNSSADALLSVVKDAVAGVKTFSKSGEFNALTTDSNLKIGFQTIDKNEVDKIVSKSREIIIYKNKDGTGPVSWKCNVLSWKGGDIYIVGETAGFLGWLFGRKKIAVYSEQELVAAVTSKYKNAAVLIEKADSVSKTPASILEAFSSNKYKSISVPDYLDIYSRTSEAAEAMIQINNSKQSHKRDGRVKVASSGGLNEAYRTLADVFLKEAFTRLADRMRKSTDPNQFCHVNIMKQQLENLENNARVWYQVGRSVDCKEIFQKAKQLAGRNWSNINTNEAGTTGILNRYFGTGDIAYHVNSEINSLLSDIQVYMLKNPDSKRNGAFKKIFDNLLEVQLSYNPDYVHTNYKTNIAELKPREFTLGTQKHLGGDQLSVSDWVAPDLEEVARNISEMKSSGKVLSYDRRVIIQLESSNYVQRSSQYLFQKNSLNSIWVQPDTQGADGAVRAYVLGDKKITTINTSINQLPVSGSVQLSFIGSGDGGQIGGMGPENIASIVEQFMSSENIKKININLVGCNMIGPTDSVGESFGGRLLALLAEQNNIEKNNVSVTVRNGLVFVNEDGTKSVALDDKLYSGKEAALFDDIRYKQDLVFNSSGEPSVKSMSLEDQSALLKEERAVENINYGQGEQLEESARTDAESELFGRSGVSHKSEAEEHAESHVAVIDLAKQLSKKWNMVTLKLAGDHSLAGWLPGMDCVENSQGVAVTYRNLRTGETQVVTVTDEGDVKVFRQVKEIFDRVTQMENSNPLEGLRWEAFTNPDQKSGVTDAFKWHQDEAIAKYGEIHSLDIATASKRFTEILSGLKEPGLSEVNTHPIEVHHTIIAHGR